MNFMNLITYMNLIAYMSLNKILIMNALCHSLVSCCIFLWPHQLAHICLAVDRLSKVITLKQELENSIHGECGRRMQSALKSLLQLFEHPVVTKKYAQVIC